MKLFSICVRLRDWLSLMQASRNSGDFFVEKCEEMTTFFEDRGYPSDLLRNDQERVHSISDQEALEKRVRHSEERIALVLTYHPLSSRIKHILLNNFNILMSNPRTAAIFPAPPIVAYRRHCSLRDLLVHTSDHCVTDEPGTFACEHPRCRTCQYTTSDVHVRGPKCSKFYHPRALQLQIGEHCLLHLVPLTSKAVHWGNRTFSPRAIRRTPTKR